ncbi:MAG: glycosyltransferase family 9 protein [Terriglobia bacterium]
MANKWHDKPPRFLYASNFKFSGLSLQNPPANFRSMNESKKKLLVIRLSSIGDIVHALPAVAALGEAFPSTEITWAVERRYACLIEGNPHVRHILKLDTLGWRGRWGSLETFRQMRRALRALRNPHFDTAIDFQGLIKSGLIVLLSRAQQRVGLAGPWLREPLAGIFYTEKVTPPARRHIVEANLALVEHLGAQAGKWQFPLPHRAEDEEYAKGQIERMGGGPFVLISPGGGWSRKRWAPSNYAALIKKLDAEFPGEMVLTGSPSEESMIREILDAAHSRRARYLAASITQYIAMARRASLFVGGDTGPMHLAAAVGTPVVALHGPTDPARNGPFSDEDIALAGRPEKSRGRRHPGFLEGIEVDQVMRAIRRRMESQNG